MCTYVSSTQTSPCAQVVVAPPEQQEQLCTVYCGTDDIKGKITVTVKEGRVMDHDGISIELIGRTEILESPEVQMCACVYA